MNDADSWSHSAKPHCFIMTFIYTEERMPNKLCILYNTAERRVLKVDVTMDVLTNAFSFAANSHLYLETI